MWLLNLVSWCFEPSQPQVVIHMNRIAFMIIIMIIIIIIIILIKREPLVHTRARHAVQREKKEKKARTV